MNLKQSILLLPAVTLMLLLSHSCFAQQQKVKVATIGFYNLENLFDTIDDPKINDEEFLPGGLNKWNSERYNHKLKNMSEVISMIGDEYIPGGPTIIGFSEIENRRVLEDLIATDALRNSGYGIVHVDGPDRRGVDVGLIYKKKDFKVTSVRSVFLGMPSDTGWRTRDQLVVTGNLDGETISVIVNHWPSRGNQPPYRAVAAALTRRLADSLYNINPDARIFIMGDLNDDPVDPSVFEVLGAQGKPEKVKKGMLFNPMYKMFKDGIGSLAYRDAWNLFDQIIISEPLLNGHAADWKFYKAMIFKRSFLLTAEGQYAGYPFRTFAGGAYAGGYSDHFPVYVALVKEKK